MLTNHHVWYLSLLYWDWAVTKWAHWDLNILKIMNKGDISDSDNQNSHKQKGTMVLSTSKQSTDTDTRPPEKKALLASRINSKAP